MPSPYDKGDCDEKEEDGTTAEQTGFFVEIGCAPEEYERSPDEGRNSVVAVPCYHPVTAWRGRTSGPSGKQRLVWNKADSCGVEVQLPCGGCIGCRLQKSRDWAVRMMHEASLHEDNCFVTLTYNEENLPPGGSLRKKDYQDFMKRLRRRFDDRRIRFFHCGEYGERLGRPHYHACLFGFDFPDRKPFKGEGEGRLDTSAILDSVWGNGFCTVGSVTFDSAAYVARYVMKKVTGPAAADHYARLGPDDVLFAIAPEYSTMSRRPGLGTDWLRRFGMGEVYSADEVIVNGRPAKPPRFYDKKLEEEDGERLKSVVRERLRRSNLKQVKENNTPRRLKDRETVKLAQINMLKRGFESE